MHLLKVQHFVAPYRSIFHTDPFQQKYRVQMYTSSGVHSSSRYPWVEKWRRARRLLLAVGERKQLPQYAIWASSAMGMSTAEKSAPPPAPHTPKRPTATPFCSYPSSFLQLSRCLFQFKPDYLTSQTLPSCCARMTVLIIRQTPCVSLPVSQEIAGY